MTQWIKWNRSIYLQAIPGYQGKLAKDNGKLSLSPSDDVRGPLHDSNIYVLFMVDGYNIIDISS